MRDEKNMHTLDDFEAFLNEAEHPSVNFPVVFQMSVQNPEPAIALCDALIDGEKQPLFYIARGHAYQSAEDYDAAIADYDAFLTDDGASDLPAFPFAMAHFQKGMCYLSLEDNDTAKICFETAIELNPHVSDHYRGHAAALVGLGMADAAWETMGDAIEAAADTAEESELRVQRFSALAEYLPDAASRMLTDSAFAQEMRADLNAVAGALDAGTAPPEIASIPEIRDMIAAFQALQNDSK